MGQAKVGCRSNCISGRPVFSSYMKQIPYLILSIVVGMVLAGSPAFAADKKADLKKTEKADKAATSQAADAKITKEAAQKLVMQKYPVAQMTGTPEMGTVKVASVWIVMLRLTSNNVVEKVAVDAQSGKISRM